MVGQTCEITFEHRGRGRRGDGEQGYGQHDGDRLLVADTCGTRDRNAILGSAEARESRDFFGAMQCR